jgi:hypothetical protein
MTTQLTIRFQKLDQYNNAVFIAGSEDVDAYTLLSKFNTTLSNMDLSTFLPIYKSDTYATIRFKANNKFKFSENSTYAIGFEIRKKITKDKTYISCYLIRSKLLIKAEPKDIGELIELV